MFRRCPEKEYLQPKAACQAHQADARQSSTILNTAALAYAPDGVRYFQWPDSAKGIKFDTRMDEVDTLEAIRKRRSIRRYTDDAIPKTDLETIVDVGRLAATGSNRQPWDFVVVTDRTIIRG